MLENALQFFGSVLLSSLCSTVLQVVSGVNFLLIKDALPIICHGVLHDVECYNLQAVSNFDLFTLDDVDTAFGGT
jgi:hypothetical protein